MLRKLVCECGAEIEYFKGYAFLRSQKCLGSGKNIKLDNAAIRPKRSLAYPVCASFNPASWDNYQKYLMAHHWTVKQG